MTRFPTSGALLLLIALLVTPVSAQVIMGGSPLGIPGSGTVTSIATTSPITGGTITSSGTIACPTCTTGSGTSGTMTAWSSSSALGNGGIGTHIHSGTAGSVMYLDASGNLAQSDINGNTNFVYDPALLACKGTALCMFTEALPIAGTAGLTGIGSILFIDTASTFPANQSYMAGGQFGASHGGSGNITPNVNGGLVGMTAFATVGGSGNAAEAAGMFSQVTLNDDDGGGGNITTASAISAIPPSNYSAAGVITTGYGLWLKNSALVNGITATGTVTNLTGIRLDTQTSQHVTTFYGAFIDAQALATTTNVGLHIGNITGASTTNRAIETGTGDVVLGTLTTTGAATGKTVVCADTNGKLYRSSAGNSCAN